MKKTGKRTPIRFLSLLLAELLLVGAIPFSVSAEEGNAGLAAKTEALSEQPKQNALDICTVTAHGGIIESENAQSSFEEEVKRGTVLQITLDESAFEGHTFACWRGDDGTEIPQKSFRLLAERSCAFYPVFSDLIGSFGEWREYYRGVLCTDGVIYVREDTESGLKEFKRKEGLHSFGELYEQVDGDCHKETCSRCGYEENRSHWFSDGSVTTEPTHSEEGVKTYVCRQCGYVKTEPVPAVTDSTAHTYGEWEIITEARDGQPGYRKRTCACGASEEGYYIKAEWEKYYKGSNAVLQTIDKVGGRTQNEWHYSFTDSDGRDIYIYMLKRVGTTGDDAANYGFMFADDHTDSLKPVYVMKSRAKYGYYNTYEGYGWSQLGYARNADEYISLIDSMVLYGGGRTSKYSSRVFDAFRAWEELYNRYPKNTPDWYVDAGFTRTEREYLGYDCWEYRKPGSISYYDDVYYVVKSDNTCLYALADTSRGGYEITAVKDMFYEDTLPTFDESDTSAEYNWRRTHCVVNEIGTAEEQLSKTDMAFSAAPPQSEYTEGFRFYVDHYPLPQGSSATYHFGYNGGEYDQSFNFDIIPRFNYISGRDYMNEDDFAVTLVERTDEKYNFDHWEKYDWETGAWSVYDGPLKFNYVIPERDGDGGMVFNEDGSASLLEDHRLTDIMYFRGIYELKTLHIKVDGGTFMYNGETVSEADVPYGTVISLNYDSKDGYSFDGFSDTDGNRLYYREYSSITVERDMTYTAEYTVQIVSSMQYIGAEAKNGSVLMNGEEFYGGEFEKGTELTLTTEGYEGYPYFLGWYLSDGKSDNRELISKETELHYTVTEYAELFAHWSKTETEKKHSIQVVNGFARSGYEMLAVSAVSSSDNRDITVIKDPANPLRISRWVLSGAYEDGGEVIERQELSEYGNSFYLYEGLNDGKGYPWSITITGEADICEVHDWNEGEVTKQPTYVEYGELTYTCNACGMQKTESIPMLARYCVHACGSCGGCTLDPTDGSCNFARCTCENRSALPTQNGPVLSFNHTGDGEITPKIYTVLYEEQTENPYVQYVLRATEGYDIAEIYDISFTDADGNKYTPSDGESVTVTLTVGKANARAIADGRMFIIHITDNGNVIYGSGHEPITADTDAGTVTFTVDEFSPFVLVRNAGEYCSVYGTVTSFLSESEDITAELIPEGEASADCSTVIHGNSAGYSINGVVPGVYTVRVSKADHVTREYRITVGTADVELNAKIHPIGDINGDGKITNSDVNKANLHTKRKAQLTGYELDCADINRDGKITNSDVNKMNLHAKKKTPLW